MKLSKCEDEFKRAKTGYLTTGSAAARKRLTRALIKFLKAGGKVRFKGLI